MSFAPASERPKRNSGSSSYSRRPRQHRAHRLRRRQLRPRPRPRPCFLTPHFLNCRLLYHRRIMERAALISVSDRTGIVEFCRELQALGFIILTTSGSGKALADAGIPSTAIEEYTGQRE